MNRTKAKHEWLREQGEHDARSGKDRDAFYALPKTRTQHTELDRGSYEIGWRYAREQMRAAERESA